MRQTLMLAVLLVLPSSVLAWEARVFQGAPARAATSDLHPRVDHAGGTFYSEDFNFSFSLNHGASVKLKFGMSNLLGGHGSAFATGAFRTRKSGAREKLHGTIPPGAWSFSADPFTLIIDKIKFSGDAKQMVLGFDGEKVAVTLRLSAVVPGWKAGSGKVEFADSGFVEMVVWPKLEVEGTLTDKQSGETTEVAGLCLLTHAVTTVAPHLMPDRWFYFKGLSRTNPVLFQGVRLSEQFGGGTYAWLLAVEDDRFVAESTSLFVEEIEVRSADGAELPWGLFAEERQGSTEVGIRVTRYKGFVDKLKRLSKLQAAIVRKFINPRTYRFAAELEFTLPSGETRRVQGKYVIETVH